MTEDTLADSSTTARALIAAQVCPPWWVPSQPLFGRCLPFFYQDTDGNNMTADSVVVEDDETPTGESVTGGMLKAAVKKVFILSINAIIIFFF